MAWQGLLPEVARANILFSGTTLSAAKFLAIFWQWLRLSALNQIFVKIQSVTQSPVQFSQFSSV